MNGCCKVNVNVEGGACRWIMRCENWMWIGGWVWIDDERKLLKKKWIDDEK